MLIFDVRDSGKISSILTIALVLLFIGLPGVTQDNRQGAQDQRGNGVTESLIVTPTQGEGPYYPLENLADRDNDLLVIDGSDEIPSGQILMLSGKLLWEDGSAAENAIVEIWQTDEHGVYLHPRDPGYEKRDKRFQFYGESETAADGSYSFKTLLPGLYGNRPRHIHVKVRLNGSELLTTQIYFAGDSRLQGLGSEEVNALVTNAEVQVERSGDTIFVAEYDIVLK